MSVSHCRVRITSFRPSVYFLMRAQTRGVRQDFLCGGMRPAGHLQRDGRQLTHFNTNQEFDLHPSPLKYVENSRNNA